MLTVEQTEDIAIVTVAGKRLDSANSRDFKAEIAPVLAAHRKLVLDLSELTYVDSSGLGAMLSSLRQATGGGGDLKLCCLSKPVRALIELVRMHRIFEILNTREEAVRAFGG